MNRRQFFTVSGIALAAAAVSGGTTLAIEEYRIYQARMSGHSVGNHRPAGLANTMVVWRAQISQPLVALTFDDGPDPTYTPQVLSALAAANVSATFFMLGREIARHPELAKRVASRHAIGNHTYSHRDLSNATAAIAEHELVRTHELIEKTTGHYPVAFRPPYGRFSGAAAMVAGSLEYDIVLWSDRVNSHQTANHNLNRLRHNVKPGAVVLAHDGGGSMPNAVVVQALPHLLQHLTDHGLKPVTIPELLAAIRAEQIESPPVV